MTVLSQIPHTKIKTPVHCLISNKKGHANKDECDSKLFGLQQTVYLTDGEVVGRVRHSGFALRWFGTNTELKKEGRGESGARCDVELEVRALPPLQLSTKRHTPTLVSCSGPGVRIAFPLLTAGAGAAPHA